MTTNIAIYPTAYYGIHRQCETDADGSRHWWITDDNGGEVYFGAHRPTDAVVDDYRLEAIA